jgi:hypothetical protein
MNSYKFEFKLQRLSQPLVQSRHVVESRCVTHRPTLVLISCMHREMYANRRRWSKSGSLRHHEPDATTVKPLKDSLLLGEFDALVNVTSIGHDRIIPMLSLKHFFGRQLVFGKSYLDYVSDDRNSILVSAG